MCFYGHAGHRNGDSWSGEESLLMEDKCVDPYTMELDTMLHNAVDNKQPLLFGRWFCHPSEHLGTPYPQVLNPTSATNSQQPCKGLQHVSAPSVQTECYVLDSGPRLNTWIMCSLSCSSPSRPATDH